MKPRIMFHDIASVRFSPTLTLTNSQTGKPFACRDVVFVDRDGKEFSVGLFGDTAAQLRVEGDAEPVVAEPVESHPGIVVWIATDRNTDEERVEMAIERWHVEVGTAGPSDEDYAAATWFVPSGTTLESHPDIERAERVRVAMPNGARYIIEIQFDADCDGDGFVEERAYFVREFQQLSAGDYVEASNRA